MDETTEPQEEKPSKRKKIPTETKILAKVMTESGFGQRETARKLDVPLMVVQRAIKDATLDRDLIEKVKTVLPGKLYAIAFALAERLQNRPDAIEKMNPYMCALVMGIMIDKARLMDGQSTANLAVQGTVAEIQTTLERIAEMKKHLAQNPAPQEPA